MGETTDQLKADIEYRRERMSGTVDAIEDRVVPGRIIRRRTDAARGWMGQARTRVMGPPQRVKAQVGAVPGQAAVGCAPTRRERDRICPSRSRTRPAARRSWPAVIAFGVGALIALLLPETPPEQHLAETLEPQISTLTDAAKETAHAATDTVKESAQQSVDELKDVASEHATKATEQAREAAEQVEDTAKDDDAVGFRCVTRRRLHEGSDLAGQADVSVEEVPDPRSRSRPTRSSGSRRRTSAARTCTSTRRSARSWAPATSSATSPWASSRRSAPRSATSRSATGSSSRSRSPAGTASCATQQLYTQCETTQVRDQGMGAALFGFSKLYGEVPGGQAEYLRVPQAQFTHIKVPDGPPDDRFVYLSDVLPTAWQAVEYADVPDGRHARRPRPRPDRRHGLPHRPARGRPGHRRRPGARAARARPPPRRRGRRPRRARRRPRRRSIREHDRRPRPRLGDRRRRHGGARLARRQAGAAGRRAAARRARRAADAEGRRRPARRALLRHRHRPPRRHHLADRRLRRHGRPDADA